MKRNLCFKYFLLMFCMAFAMISCHDDDEKVELANLTVNGGRDFVSTNSKGRSVHLEINSTTPWQLDLQEVPEWLTVDKLSGAAGKSTVTLTLSDNTGEARHHEIAFTNGQDNIAFTVQQSAANADFDTAPDYYFYVTFGSMPTLYAGLHLLSHDKPSYFFYERVNTFDKDLLPSHAVYVEGPRDNVKSVIMQKILEINAKEPDAVFGFQMDDLRARLGHDFFVKQGIDSSRVKVTMLSDGTGTYNEFYKAFGDAASGETAWNEYKTLIDGLDWDATHPMQPEEGTEFESFNWAYYLSTCPNYKLQLQDASLLETENPFVKDEILKMKAVTVTPLELLNRLSPERQAEFYKMSSFDKGYFEDLFAASSKPNLVIIGTNTGAGVEGASPEDQHRYVEQIMEKYGETHDVFFKPHPSDEASKEYDKEFPGLSLLPGQMPFEIFVWSLNDQIDMIGGFSSTVFLTVPVEKVKFIFGATPETIIRPLNLLFKDADIEWMN